MSWIVDMSVAWAARRQNAAFEAATRDPRAAQERLLRSFVETNAGTVFGKEHGFARIRTPADYAAAVPIRDYEKLRPYMKRIIAHEHGVLTAQDPMMFVTTSGT